MSMVATQDQFEWSRMRKKQYKISCSCLSPSGELLLKGDPGPWIENNPASCSWVRCLMLDLLMTGFQGKISESIGELTSLTHLYIKYGRYLKFPNTITRLNKLQVLGLEWCDWLELPANFGELESLRHLCLLGCFKLKSVPSIIGLYNLQKLDLSHCTDLEELPANLGELVELFYINIEATEIKWLPWSITKLPKLRFLFLPCSFRLEILPHNLNESILISVEFHPLRKTWNELREEIIAPLSFPVLEAPNQFNFSYQGSHCNSVIYPWGYLRLKGNPGPWIDHHYHSLSLVRFLDLSFEFNDNNKVIPDSIGELPELTHLYIGGGVKHLPNTITRLHKLEVLNLECCRLLELLPNLDRLANLKHLSISVNGVKESICNLEKLSHLETLSLEGDESLEELPVNLDKLVSLKRLSLGFWEIESLPVSITNLSNLTTLHLYDCPSLKVLPEKLNLSKLKLRNCSMMSLPTGLCHLELSHSDINCFEKTDCDIPDQCLNQLVNLETLAITCDRIKFLPGIARLHNLQELQLRDCFNLKELPVNLDKLVKLCFLNISGTRIKFLPSSITKLHNLQCIILPKCFKLESLLSNLNASVKVVVDTDDTYIDHVTSTETSNEGNDTAPRVDEATFKKSGHGVTAEETSPHRQTNLCNAALVMPELLHRQVRGDSHFNGSRFPIGEISHHALFGLQNQEMNFVPVHPRNEDCTATFDDNMSAESCSHLPETDLMGGNCQQALQNGLMGPASTSEYENGTALIDRLISAWVPRNFVNGGNRHHDKKQKIEIALEDIQSCLSRNMKLADAAKELGASRSTLKRKLKELGIKWQSSRKGKQCHDANRKHDNEPPSAHNSLQLNLINPSTNPASNEYAVDCLDGENQHISVHVPYDCIAADNSTPDAANAAQCRTDGYERGPDCLDGANQHAMSKAIQKNGSLSSFVVKVAYKEDVVRFDLSCTASVAELKKEVAKNLELELDRFKIKYQDEEKEWLLMTRKDHLDYALGISTSSGSNIVRLLIIDL